VSEQTPGTPIPAIPAAIYARISRDREGAGLGVERQEADCRELAAKLGWHVTDVYVDNDLSAYSGKPRPGYRRLLADIDAGRYSGVLVWHTDRLHRSIVEPEEYGALCEKRGVVTQTVKAGLIDYTTPAGWLQARLLGAVARYEVDHQRERLKRKSLELAADGEWRGGRRPFGYAADGVTVVESEAAVIAAAADIVLSGGSLRRIAADLNARGVTTSTGRAWAPREVGRVLVRPRNAGLRQHQKSVIGAAKWPAILTEDTWRALCSLLGDPARRTSPPAGRRWLGSGLYVCGVCGAPMLVSSTTTGSGVHKPGYRCRPTRGHVYRDAAAVDGFVTRAVLARLGRADAAGLLAAGDQRPDTTALHTQAQVLRTRLDELAGLFAGENPAIDARQFAAGSRDLHARLEAVQDRIARVSQRSALSVVAGVPDVGSVWAGLDLDRRRGVVDALVTVTILPGRRGRLPGGAYFDPAAVDITWKA
jgi:DNA invertase Pin-like site-specific DNA recombinase